MAAAFISRGSAFRPQPKVRVRNPQIQRRRGETMAAGSVTGDPTVEACAPKVCGNNKADAAGNFFLGGSEGMEEAQTDSFLLGGGEGMKEAQTDSVMEEAQTGRRMFMSPEDIDIILNHKARGDSFKQFQARVRKEVAETGHFEISKQYVKNVLAHQAMYRGEWSNLRSQYPNLVWEEDDDGDEEEAAKSG
ncbi:hypothetical protein D1007_42046 [Hordeum vulgare]|nr:hypothetical protein D1007_42046 [Hordeum vulgare]